VIPRLQEFDPLCINSVYQPVLLCYSPAPTPRQLEFKRFGFADSHEWISEDGGHQVKHAERSFSVGLDPVPQIFLKLARNYSDSIHSIAHSFNQLA